MTPALLLLGLPKEGAAEAQAELTSALEAQGFEVRDYMAAPRKISNAYPGAWDDDGGQWAEKTVRELNGGESFLADQVLPSCAAGAAAEYWVVLPRSKPRVAVLVLDVGDVHNLRARTLGNVCHLHETQVRGIVATCTCAGVGLGLGASIEWFQAPGYAKQGAVGGTLAEALLELLAQTGALICQDCKGPGAEEMEVLDAQCIRIPIAICPGCARERSGCTREQAGYQ